MQNLNYKNNIKIIKCSSNYESESWPNPKTQNLLI